MSASAPARRSTTIVACVIGFSFVLATSLGVAYAIKVAIVVLKGWPFL